MKEITTIDNRLSNFEFVYMDMHTKTYENFSKKNCKISCLNDLAM